MLGLVDPTEATGRGNLVEAEEIEHHIKTAKLTKKLFRTEKKELFDDLNGRLKAMEKEYN